jgi:DNA (cytosine-5)-methyltransferase 1
MKHGSLFSGIGGFDLAAEWMGWENVFHCEIAEFPRKVLKYHFPNAISYDDITKTDFTIYRGAIDILTGSDPCQPHSYAGKRKGMDDERFLWPEMLRAIIEINPRWVVNENVKGSITNGVVDRKFSDLENEGYTCWPTLVLPANAFGAIHKRDRVWMVAYSERLLESREESCDGKIRRMGREFKPLEADRNWQDMLTDFRGMDDGLPHNLDRTDGVRNAIYPRIAYQIFLAIQEYENKY